MHLDWTSWTRIIILGWSLLCIGDVFARIIISSPLSIWNFWDLPCLRPVHVFLENASSLFPFVFVSPTPRNGQVPVLPATPQWRHLELFLVDRVFLFVVFRFISSLEKFKERHIVRSFFYHSNAKINWTRATNPNTDKIVSLVSSSISRRLTPFFFISPLPCQKVKAGVQWN